ncbi:MAG: CDP-diacylglycerol--glycerol-3-phosphate 3-phosphatidyltransferase [Planctomycetia bacterium]|nr:CDP-diacylglycerol--glycerol-3-phosphate 3-phosphatidyltransferase [Planctomycetia bacterium]
MASDRIWTIPNILSLTRLLLAVVLFVAMERGLPTAAFWLFVVAASTDWVDGWWARRFGQVSRLGRILDPLVDKVIVCGSYVLLAGAGSAIAPWMVVVVVVRELVVTAIRAEMEKSGRDFSAALSGKLKMVLQCLTIGLVLAERAWPGLAPGGLPLADIAGWAAWAAVVATVWSGLEYLVAARSLVR